MFTFSATRLRAAPLLWAVLVVPAFPIAAEDAGARYATGKKLIESNCGDSYGPSRDALEKGISEIQTAIRLGLEDAEAHRLLACAYNTLKFEFAAVGPERVALAKKELAAVRRAAQLDPRDVNSRLHVAALTRDDEEKLRAYEAVLNIDRDHAVALFASGELLIRRGYREKGLARIERAGEVANPGDSAALGSGIVRILRDNGRERRADELKAKLDAKAKEAHR